MSLSNDKLRRRPIGAGDNVRHCDGRGGVVETLCKSADGLPAAVVRFGDRRQVWPLGYLEKVGSLDVD